MLGYQKAAMDAVREYAKTKSEEHRAFAQKVCEPLSVDIDILVAKLLRSPVTINFHPDRLSNNGQTVIDNLLEQGLYHGQFHTGTTNGGKSAYIGGDRFNWEQRLFFGAYPKDALARPKYGALNIFSYIDGASARFGSCYFSLKSDIVKRCTFAYGDSSTNPTKLCTCDTFASILTGLLEDVQLNRRLLDHVVETEQEALAMLLNQGNRINNIGRNLDYCIEAHVHGDISLENDVEIFYMDESFRDTPFEDKAELLCQKYGINFCRIPIRELNVADIGSLFRGAKIPILAKKIDCVFSNNHGVINSYLIGRASRDSIINPDKWHDIGNEDEVFQYFKQLWHTIAFFG